MNKEKQIETVSLSNDISLRFLDFLREQTNCCVCLEFGPVEPHHLISVGMGRDRKKPMMEHFSAVPVCRLCHTQYHAKGLKDFEEQWNQNMFKTNHKFLSKFIYEISIN